MKLIRGMNLITQSKSLLKLLTALSICVVLTGCFEVIEEVNLNADGSGSLSYTVNFSQSKTKINSALLLDSINGFKIPDEQQVNAKIDEVLNKLKKVEGLSQVKATRNFDDYIFTFSCNFSDVEKLNNASKYLNDTYGLKDKEMATASHFTFNNQTNTFKRRGDYKSKADPDVVDSEMLSSLEKAEFTSIYRFSTEVKSVSNSDAKISPNRKAVMLKHKAMDVATGKETIENTITLK